MSDIFGNLASRLQEPARLVQPRLPSLFEPVAAAGWAGGTPGPDPRPAPWEPPAADDGAEPPIPVPPPSHRAGRRRSLDAVTATAPQAEPAAPPIRDRMREAESLRPVWTAQSEADPLHTVEAPQAAPAGPVVAPPLGAVSAVHPPPPTDSAAAPRSTARPRDVTTAPVARTPVPESLSDTAGPPVPKPAPLAVPAPAERLSEEHAIGEDFGVTVEVEPGVDRWPVSAASRRRESPDLWGGPEPDRAAPGEMRGPTSMRAAVARWTGIGPTRAREPRAAAAATTIQVTIGRIEVKAAPPAAPRAAAVRTTPPVMSLDQYLRARSGGASRE